MVEFNNKVWEFDSEVQWWSLEVFLHYWWSSTVRVHYSQSSTAFWCHWQMFTHRFWSPKVIFKVHWSLVKFYEAHTWFVEVSEFIKVHQHFHAFSKFDTMICLTSVWCNLTQGQQTKKSEEQGGSNTHWTTTNQPTYFLNQRVQWKHEVCKCHHECHCVCCKRPPCIKIGEVCQCHQCWRHTVDVPIDKRTESQMCVLLRRVQQMVCRQDDCYNTRTSTLWIPDTSDRHAYFYFLLIIYDWLIRTYQFLYPLPYHRHRPSP